MLRTKLLASQRTRSQKSQNQLIFLLYLLFILFFVDWELLKFLSVNFAKFRKSRFNIFSWSVLIQWDCGILFSIFFDIQIDEIATPNFFFLQPSRIRLSSQSFNLWIMAITIVFNAMWYARNNMLHDNFFVPMDKACLFISKIIKGANGLQSDCIDSVQKDLLRLSYLGVPKLYPCAPKIITMRWQFPYPSWIKINIDGVALRCPGLVEGSGIF